MNQKAELCVCVKETDCRHTDTFLLNAVVSGVDNSRMEKEKYWAAILDRSQETLREGDSGERPNEVKKGIINI